MESSGQGVVLLTAFLEEAAWCLVKHEQESSRQPEVVAAVDTIHSKDSQQTAQDHDSPKLQYRDFKLDF